MLEQTKDVSLRVTSCDSRLCGDVLGTQGKGVTAKSGLCESHRQGLLFECRFPGPSPEPSG